MAEAAPAEKKLHFPKMKDIFEDTEFDLSSICNKEACVDTNLAASWNKITGSGWKIPNVAAGYQQWPAAWNLLAKAIPELTGVSLMFLPAANYQSYQPNLYTQAPYYQMNPKSAPGGELKVKAGDKVSDVAFYGLCAHGWSAEQDVYKEDLTSSKEQVVCNDNIIIGKLIAYSENSDAAFKAELSRLKFDFALNKYKVIKTEFKGPHCWIKAEGNQECMMLFKGPDGIMVFNWAMKEYKGNRVKVGSLKGKSSDVQNFYDELYELELLTGDKWT